MTALTSSRRAASWAAACSSVCNWRFSAFMGGRLRRMVPMPSETSRVTNSDMSAGYRVTRVAVPTGNPSLSSARHLRQVAVAAVELDGPLFAGADQVRLDRRDLGLRRHHLGHRRILLERLQ